MDIFSPHRENSTSPSPSSAQLGVISTQLFPHSPNKDDDMHMDAEGFKSFGDNAAWLRGLLLGPSSKPGILRKNKQHHSQHNNHSHHDHYEQENAEYSSHSSTSQSPQLEPISVDYVDVNSSEPCTPPLPPVDPPSEVFLSPNMPPPPPVKTPAQLSREEHPMSAMMMFAAASLVRCISLPFSFELFSCTLDCFLTRSFPSFRIRCAPRATSSRAPQIRWRA
jgi:hypothetical protein